MKYVFFVIVIFTFTSCKSNDTPAPEIDYSTLILGNWKLIETKIYYTPFGVSDQEIYYVSDTSTVFYTFNSDKKANVSIVLNGDPIVNYDYSTYGKWLILKDKSYVLNQIITKLDTASLQLFNTTNAGSTLANNYGYKYGKIKFSVTDFVKL